jgi:hypothetical protein
MDLNMSVDVIGDEETEENEPLISDDDEHDSCVSADDSGDD